jgi:HSP20 family protein
MSNLPVHSEGGQGSQAGQRRSTSSLFADLLGFDPFRSFVPAMAHGPSAFGVDVSHTDNGYNVEIPVPGFRPEDIEVTVQDDTVMVSGKNDRRSFTRSLTLPEEIDAEGITANVDHGMLSLRLPQRPETKPRQIKVQSNAGLQSAVTAGQSTAADAGQTASASTSNGR